MTWVFAATFECKLVYFSYPSVVIYFIISFSEDSGIYGFDPVVMTCEKYDVNGYCFHTEEHQNSRPDPKTINTGVFTEGDNNVDYYGRVGNIYELTFNCGRKHLSLTVFKCRWFDPKKGLRHTPSVGLVEVKPSTVYAGADLFIAATQATQVYYLPYPC